MWSVRPKDTTTCQALLNWREAQNTPVYTLLRGRVVIFGRGPTSLPSDDTREELLGELSRFQHVKAQPRIPGELKAAADLEAAFLREQSSL